ncbi:MAG: SPASM domain-containing protein [Desulfovibrio sp.]
MFYIDFVNVIQHQGLDVVINGDVVDSIVEIPSGNRICKKYTFSGASRNQVEMRYRTTSKVEGAYPDDPRDLALLFYECKIVTSSVPSADKPSEATSIVRWLGKTFGRNVERAIQIGSNSISPNFFAPSECLDIEYASYLAQPEENGKLNQSEYEEGNTVLRSLPSVVTLALTTKCNNRLPCVICDRNTRNVDFEIDEDVIHKAEPLLKTARYVLLHSGGEAMCTRHFDEIIEKVFPPTRVSFATNAMLMTKKRTDLLLKKDIMAGFVVSLDAASERMYKIMRPGSVFNTVISNVEHFAAKAAQLGRTESKITLNMTLCEANIHEAPKLVDLAASIGVASVSYNHLNSGLTHCVKTFEGWDWDYVAQSQFNDVEYHDDMLLEAYYKAKEHGLGYSFVGIPFLGKNAKKYQEVVCDMTCQVAFQEGEGVEHWSSPHHKKFGANIPSCFKPWQEIAIQPNGLVRVCCFHDVNDWCVGNLRHMDFMKIWNSPQMIRIREDFLSFAVARCCVESQPCPHRGKS